MKKIYQKIKLAHLAREKPGEKFFQNDFSRELEGASQKGTHCLKFVGMTL